MGGPGRRFVAVGFGAMTSGGVSQGALSSIQKRAGPPCEEFGRMGGRGALSEDAGGWSLY